jgi:hypothetical protein
MFGESIGSLVERRPPEELDDEELDGELTIAAAAIGRLRFDRYEELLRELELRVGTERHEPTRTTVGSESNKDLT